MRIVRLVSILCLLIVFTLWVISCLSLRNEINDLAQKMDVQASSHAIDKKIEETLVVGMLSKDVFDFAKSIDAEMIPSARCYTMRFFDDKHRLDRYICFKLGRLDTIEYLAELEAF